MNTLKIFVLSLLLGGLTGCAVMRVDVDVYKGPLADEEHLQVQRLVVMAIGAKPLLIQARDSLAGQEYTAALHAAGRYQERFIPDELPPVDQIKNGQNVLDSIKTVVDAGHQKLNGLAFGRRDGKFDVRLSKARLINNVLFLYEDNDAGEIKNLITEGRYVLNQFRYAWDRFRDNRESLANMLDCKSGDDLIKAYCKLGSKKWYEIGPQSLILNATRKNADPFKTDLPANSANYYGIDKYFNLIKNNPIIIKKHAKQVFPGNEKKQIKFTSYIESMVDDFEQSWEAQNQLLRISLQAIIAMDKDRGPSSLLSKNRLEAAIELVLTIGQRGLMYKALKDQRHKETTELKSDLKTEILKDPAGKAAILLTSDSYLKDTKEEFLNYCGDDRSFENCNRPYFCKSGPCSPKKGSRKYGLVFLPYYSFDFDVANTNIGEENPDKIDRLAKELVETFGTYIKELAGFEKGRLKEGLETLIQLYLDEHDSSSASPQTLRAQERLSDALVRFAQKLLFVSQNSAFLDVGRQVGDNISKQEIKQFENQFGIIEIVANSILVQANELQARKLHKDRMADKYHSTLVSIEQEFSASNVAVVNRLLALIEAQAAQLKVLDKELKRLQTAEKTALDPLNQTKLLLQTKKTQLGQISLTAGYKNYKTVYNLLQDQAINTCYQAAIKASPGPSPAPTNNCLTQDSELKSYAGCLSTQLAAAAEPFNQERLDQLTALEQILQAHPSGQSCTLDAFKQQVNDTFVDHTQQNSAALGQQQKLNTEIKDLETKKSTEEQSHKAKQSARKAFEQLHPKVTVRLAFYTAEAIQLIKGAARNLLSGNNEQVSAEQLMADLRQHISNSGDVSEDKALSILGESILPVSIPADLLKQSQEADPQDARAAVDALITWMETNRIKVLQDQGKDSAAFVRATAALEEAYRERAGLNYLRPASSYLRSSYTSTAVQQSNHLEWNNMLGESYLRATPLFGQDLANQGIHRALNNIDKQFWQNVNTVRVSGGGLSNYVLVKDDVGNWNIRGFTTNYENTVRALRNLAMFNYSEKLGVQLLDRQGDPFESGEHLKISADAGGLPGLFGNYRDRFAAARKASYDVFDEKLSSTDLAQQIKSKWDANDQVKEADHLDEIKTLAQSKYDEILSPVVDKLDIEKALADGDLIYDLLRALRKYQLAVNGQITAKLTDEINAQVTAAQIAPPTSNDHDTAAETTSKTTVTPVSVTTQSATPVSTTITSPVTTETTDNVNDDDSSNESSSEAGLTELLSKQTAQKAAAIAAIEDVKALINPLISSTVAARTSSVTEYERALLFIGEAVNQNSGQNQLEANDSATQAGGETTGH